MQVWESVWWVLTGYEVNQIKLLERDIGVLTGDWGVDGLTSWSRSTEEIIFSNLRNIWECSTSQTWSKEPRIFYKGLMKTMSFTFCSAVSPSHCLACTEEFWCLQLLIFFSSWLVIHRTQDPGWQSTRMIYQNSRWEFSETSDAETGCDGCCSSSLLKLRHLSSQQSMGCCWWASRRSGWGWVSGQGSWRWPWRWGQRSCGDPRDCVVHREPHCCWCWGCWRWWRLSPPGLMIQSLNQLMMISPTCSSARWMICLGTLDQDLSDREEYHGLWKKMRNCLDSNNSSWHQSCVSPGLWTIRN